ncbi:hypothetical protein ACN6K9_006843 [Streptomyces sp. SAS_267]
MPDIEGRADGVLVAFQTELFQQVVELAIGAGGGAAWMVVVRALT